MCDPATLIALGSAVLGTANQVKSTNDQSRIADEANRRAAELNRKAGARVSEETQRLRESDSSAEEADAQNDFMTALRKSRTDQGGDALGGPGGDRFADDLGLARTAVGAEGKRTAQLLSRIDAPQFQRAREGTSFNNAATDLSLLANQGRGDDFITQLRLARSGPDPGVQALADFGGAYGASRAKRMKPAAPNLYTLTPNESADITRGFRP